MFCQVYSNALRVTKLKEGYTKPLTIWDTSFGKAYYCKSGYFCGKNISLINILCSLNFVARLATKIGIVWQMLHKMVRVFNFHWKR